MYLIPPDLFVQELTRDCIEKTVSDLLKLGDLEKILNSRILLDSKKFSSRPLKEIFGKLLFFRKL
jgi:hypothetical protein